MPCGTKVTLRRGSRTVRIRVIDRGPYVGGREYELTEATAQRPGSPATVPPSARAEAQSFGGKKPNAAMMKFRTWKGGMFVCGCEPPVAFRLSPLRRTSVPSPAAA